MATLQKIRSKGPLLVGVIALALFAFVAGDAFKVFQPRQPHDVGEVNGNSLSIAEYQKMVDEFSEIQKMLGRTSSLSDEQMNQIKDNVWNTYLDNVLLEEQARKVGLTVTPEEVASVLDEGNDPILGMLGMFVNEQTGRFDKERLYDFLNQYAVMASTPGLDPNVMNQARMMHSIWVFAEKNIIQNLLANKYTTLVSSAMITNKIEAEDAFNGRVSNSNLIAAVFPYSSINASDVTEEDLRKEYDANKEMFVQKEETRRVKFIDVEITPSKADVDSLESEIAEYVEMLKSNTADYASIVSISNSNIPYLDTFLSLDAYPQDIVAHIKDSKVQVGEVFGPITNSIEGTINAFKVVDTKTLPNSYEFRVLQVAGLAPEAMVTKTDSIVNALSKGGDFAEIATSEGQSDEKQTLTEQTISNQLEFVIYNTLASMKNFEVKAIDVQGGKLIVQCLSSKDNVLKHKLAVVKRPIEFSQETANVAYNAFSQFVAENPTMDLMTENAENAGYQVLEREIDTQSHGIAGISSTKDALRWVFDAKAGQVSNIYECGSNNNHLLVVSLTEVVKEGYRPLHLVKDVLRNRVIIEKKAELVSTQLATVKSIDEAKSIDNAQVADVKYVTFSEPAFITIVGEKEKVVSGFAAGAQANVLSKPLKGDFGVYMLSVDEKSNTAETFDLAKETQSIERGYNFIVNRALPQTLVENAKIVDVRYKFF